jgi:hypothetical protein
VDRRDGVGELLAQSWQLCRQPQLGHRFSQRVTLVVKSSPHDQQWAVSVGTRRPSPPTGIKLAPRGRA